MKLDFFTHWMITGSVGVLCVVAAWILMLIERYQSRKRRH
jgi:hypothetical protein